MCPFPLSLLCVYFNLEIPSIVDLFSDHCNFSVKPGMWPDLCPTAQKACCSACVLHSKSHADQSSFLTPVVLKDCMLKIQHIFCTHNWWDNSLIWFNWLSDSTNSFLIWISQIITWHQGTKITTSNQHYTPGWKNCWNPKIFNNLTTLSQCSQVLDVGRVMPCR